jgi:type VI secretion system protein ImpA
MAIGENLLAPIPGENPSGQNLRYVPIYDKIKEARRKEEVIAQGDWQRPLKEADYRQVIKLASEALATKGKDLQVAAWLTEALIYEEGISGLRDGVKLLRGLLENFWDSVFPEPEDGDLELRAAPLNWVGDYRDVELAIHQVALTTSGLDWFKYKESQTVGYESDAPDGSPKADARNKAIKEGKLTAEEFDKEFSATPKADYQKMVTDCEQSLEELELLNTFCEARFGDTAPSFRRVRVAVEDIQHVARLLLARKRQQEPDPVEVEEAAAEPVSEEVEAVVEETPRAAAPPKKSKAQSSEPVDRDDAIRRVVEAARYLRTQNPADPIPYLVLRSLRWGELRAQGSAISPDLLEAPPTELRQQLKKFALDGAWDKVLETTETAMTLPCGRGWLDVQRYAVKACAEMGAESVASAITNELKTLLAEFPDLPALSLMDDTPTANSETQSWIRELTPPPPVAEPEPPPPAPVAVAALEIHDNGAGDKAVEIDVFERAMETLRSEGSEEAISLLTREIAHERSGRGRFLRRLQLAQICVRANRETIAHAILDELAREIELRHLEEWELPETIAQALALLFHCMDDSDAGNKRKIYAQICRLDPLQAARLGG